MPITTINISLPQTLKGEVEAIIEQEGYGNVSEFFRDLIRNHIKERELKRIEALLLEALDSGEPTPWTKQDVVDIQNHVLEQVRKKKQGKLEDNKNSKGKTRH